MDQEQVSYLQPHEESAVGDVGRQAAGVVRAEVVAFDLRHTEEQQIELMTLSKGFASKGFAPS